MGILTRMMETRASIEDPRVPISEPGVLAQLFGDAFKAASGITVTVEKALSVPSFWGGTNFISSTIAALPLQVFRLAGDSREAAKNDPLYGLLHDVVNEDKLTSYKWRKMQMMSVFTEGRAFTYIERNRAMRTKNLWPLDPSTVTVKRADNRTFYEVKDGGRKKIEYESGEILDLPFMLAKDGISHRAPVSTLKNALALAIALEEYASRFFQNGGVPPLVMQGPATSSGAIDRATSSVDDAIRRANDENKAVLYMPPGHELKPLAFNPEQGQLIEARKFQLQEIARILGLPPTFLQDLSHGTFSNTEQQDLHFVKHTLTQWLEMWEQELNAKLVAGTSRTVEFNSDGLLRGDFKSRMDGYGVAVQNAIRTPNEIRQKENLPPEAGGDRLFIQSGTVPIMDMGQTGAVNTGETEDAE